MQAASTARTIAMLKAVLEGETYAQVARRMQVGASAVEKRVKLMEVDIRQTVGVEGAPCEGRIGVATMRRLKSGYLTALEKYDPQVEPREAVGRSRTVTSSARCE
jgi:hypothetical protein